MHNTQPKDRTTATKKIDTGSNESNLADTSPSEHQPKTTRILSLHPPKLVKSKANNKFIKDQNTIAWGGTNKPQLFIFPAFLPRFFPVELCFLLPSLLLRFFAMAQIISISSQEEDIPIFFPNAKTHLTSSSSNSSDSSPNPSHLVSISSLSPSSSPWFNFADSYVVYEY